MINKPVSLFRSSFVYSLGDMISKGLNFILLPIYLGYLSEAEYGEITFTLSITAFLNILFGLGFAGAVTRLYYDCKSEEARKRLLGTAALFLILFSIGLTFLLVLVGNNLFFERFFGLPFKPYGIYAIAISLCSVMSVIPQAIFKIQNRPVVSILFNISVFLLTILFTVIFVVVFKSGVRGAISALVLSNLLVAAGYTATLIKEIHPCLDRFILSNLLILSLPFIPHLLAHWSLSQSDRLVISHFLDMSSVGAYSIGYQIGSLVFLTANAMNNAWVPYYYQVLSNATDKKSLQKSVKQFLFLISGASVVTVCLSPLILSVLKVENQSICLQIIALVSMAGFFQMCYFIFVSQTFQTKDIALIPVITVAVALANIAANIYAVPRFGILAAALTTLLAYFFLAVLNGWLALEKSRFNIGIGLMIRFAVITMVWLTVCLVLSFYIQPLWMILLPFIWLVTINLIGSFSFSEMISMISHTGSNSEY